MTYTTVELAIMGLSLITIVRLLPAVASYLRLEATRGSATGLLILIMGGFIAETELLKNSQAFKLFFAVPLLLALLSQLAIRSPKPARAVSIKTVILILVLSVWLAAINLYQNATVLSDGDLLIRFAPSLIWLAVLAGSARSSLDRRMLSITATFSMALIGAMVPLAEDSWRPCEATKCGVFDGMLISFYASENFMGQQVTFVVILHLATFGIKRTLHLLPLAAMWLLATESRTAQYALIAALAVWFIVHFADKLLLDRRRFEGGVGMHLFSTSIPIIFLLVAANLALTSERNDFSGRGWVWASALELLRGHEVIGLGVASWDIHQQIGNLPPHLYAHSFLVFLAFSGGLVALLLFALLARQALLSSLRRDRAFAPGLALVTAFMTLGLLEVVWNPATIDGMTWIPLTLALTRGQPTQVMSHAVEEPNNSTKTPARRHGTDSPGSLRDYPNHRAQRTSTRHRLD